MPRDMRSERDPMDYWTNEQVEAALQRTIQVFREMAASVHHSETADG